MRGRVLFMFGGHAGGIVGARTIARPVASMQRCPLVCRYKIGHPDGTLRDSSLYGSLIGSAAMRAEPLTPKNHARPFHHGQAVCAVWRITVRAVCWHACDRGSEAVRGLPYGWRGCRCLPAADQRTLSLPPTSLPFPSTFPQSCLQF